MSYPRGKRRDTFPKPPYSESSGTQYSVKLRRKEYGVIRRVADQQHIAFAAALTFIVLDWEKKHGINPTA